MPVSAPFIKEFDQEMATTRHVLERVPSDKGEWKPHPKSFPLAHLAQLIATMPGWITSEMTGTSLDIASGSGYTTENTETLLGVFDKHVKEAREALANASDADFDVAWSLKAGPHTIMTMPRNEVVRQTINHLCHHRGQMTVYLRLLDVPVPSIYGPTADEKAPGF